eukprot:CAMPEP_0194424308 /NCGR_PEP_ID=MMETSP0176-20130528/23581_1 /TAXON_ID=216777 /ORGANISM="Proboscia alata, Strain PI-D3" /LENGTH=953 /DNA_ID=CAMNT_0039233999 /DNA_START=45 /DNA_END=2906 /DNA_ORIENTATION=+
MATNVCSLNISLLLLVVGLEAAKSCSSIVGFSSTRQLARAAFLSNPPLPSSYSFLAVDQASVTITRRNGIYNDSQQQRCRGITNSRFPPGGAIQLSAEGGDGGDGDGIITDNDICMYGYDESNENKENERRENYRELLRLEERRQRLIDRSNRSDLDASETTIQRSRGQKNAKRDPSVCRLILDDLFCKSRSGSGTTTSTKKSSSSSATLIELNLAGFGMMKSSSKDNNNMDSNGETATTSGPNSVYVEKNPCLFLAPVNDCPIPPSIQAPENVRNKRFQAMVIPLSSSNFKNILSILKTVYVDTPISKSRCLVLNQNIINRENGLFDNLPWYAWTVTKKKKTNPDNNNNRDFDAAGNKVLEKFHFGKRDAFNTFLGKDWSGRSLSIGNLAQKALQMVEEQDVNNPDAGGGFVQSNNDLQKNKINSSSGDDLFDEEASSILAKRILQIEIKELKMELAQAEQSLAILKQQEQKDSTVNVAVTIAEAENMYLTLRTKVNDLQTALDLFISSSTIKPPRSSTAAVSKGNTGVNKESNITQRRQRKSSFLTNFLSQIVSLSSQSLDGSDNAPPYRGAYGYAPLIDSKEDNANIVSRLYPYTGPYDILLDILSNQLRASVLGTVLEDAWIFDEDKIMLGGAIVLKRDSPPGDNEEYVMIDGEVITNAPPPLDDNYDLDDDDNYSRSKESVPVQTGDVSIVECDTDEAIAVALASQNCISVERNLWESLSMTVVYDEYFNDDEDDQKNNTVDTSSFGFLPKIIPLEGDDGDKLFKSSKMNEVTDSIATDKNEITIDNVNNNPIHSVETFYSLSIQEKAQILVMLNSFPDKTKIPRPRVLRQEGNDSSLDRLLLPLIDESTRRQLLLRDAEERGDTNTVRRLERGMSKRQQYKELSDNAKTLGNDETARVYEYEAKFYEDLRADVTQDEGSYDSYLDKDEWYERQRLRAMGIIKKDDDG